VEVYPGGFSKNSRILAMFKQLKAGEIFISPECKGEVFMQISQWNPLKRDNVDDILDLLAYAPKVLEMYGEYVASASIWVQQDGDSMEVLGPERTCAF